MVAILVWERLMYGAAYHFTPLFRKWLAGRPAKALGNEQLAMHAVVASFKLIQLAVFFGVDGACLAER